jgi:protocatechuate 3,4-dioxygenase, beta subunit
MKTLLTPLLMRRRMLVATAAAIGVPSLARHAHSQTRFSLTPSQDEGPFYPVQLPADSDADLLLNADRRYGQGQPVSISGTVTDESGRALRGAMVEVWQCDHQGRYHHPRERGPADVTFQGFGRAIAGSDGTFLFRAMRPVAYPGRTAHIHFKVKLGARDLLTTQLYVEGDPGNERDGPWRRLSAADRAAITKPFKPGAEGLTAVFPIVVAA